MTKQVGEWVSTTLGGACEVNPPKPKLAKLSDETEVMFVPMAAVDEVTGAVTTPEIRSLGSLRTKSYRTFAPGDVIFAKITPCMENGKSAIVPSIESEIGFGSTEFHVLRPRPGTDARFIWHFVRQESFRRAAEEHMTGSVGQLRVSVDFLRSVKLELPDEGTQAQISESLDAALTAGRSGQQHIATANAAMQRFRQAVLASACSGHLTRDWRNANTTEPSAALVAEIQDARHTRLGRRFKASPVVPADEDLPETWCVTTVGALVDVATGATPLRSRADYFGGIIPWVKSGATRTSVIRESTEFITDLAIKETNTKVFPAGTLVVAMYGEGQTRGRVAELGIAAATNQALAALLFDEDTEALRPYLHLFFLENYERIRQLSFGGVQPNLSLGVIKETQLPLPPLEEQIEIVSRVKSLFDIAERLQSRILRAAPRIDQSSRAVLAKAFRGELLESAR